MSKLNPLVIALSSALLAGDEGGFQALCSPTGWESRGDSARRLWHQGSKKRWALVAAPGSEHIAGDRGTSAVAILQPDRGIVARTNLLCILTDDGWRLEGVNNSARFAELFIQGKVPALLSAKDLPGDADADAWGEAALEDLAASLAGLDLADRYVKDASAPGITPTLVESRYLESVDRATVLYHLAEDGNDYPDKMAVLLERADGGWRAIKVAARPGIDLLIG